MQQQVLADGFGEAPARVDYAITNERRSLLAGEEINRITMATVTEEAVKAAYDAKFADSAPSTEYNASHLLVETEEEALAAKARIDAGEDFADRCQRGLNRPDWSKRRQPWLVRRRSNGS